jgi:uncharacterized protein (DUF2147 family)
LQKVIIAPVLSNLILSHQKNPFIKNTTMRNQTKTSTNYSFTRKSVFCVLILLAMFCKAQSKADDVLGKYVVPSKDGAIEVFEQNGKYFGKVILNKDPDKLDLNNPDKEKRNRKVLGLIILNNFVFEGHNTWENGSIYDPKNGKTYDCKITRLENGDLNIRGYIGISLLGRTETFMKISN